MNSPVPARRFLLVCFVTAMPLCGADFPGAEWTRATPQEAELDEPLLHQARDYALTAGGAGCIIRGGKMVLSWGDLAHRFDLKSTTKSFGSAALALAIKDGKVRLHDKAQTHHPTFGTPPAANAQTGWVNEITLFDLGRRPPVLTSRADMCRSFSDPERNGPTATADPIGSRNVLPSRTDAISMR
jgi:CubicO group peptidase (beta-lactamase class C family)